MTVHPINPTTALLYLTREQLRQRGLHPDFLTREHSIELAREGLSSIGQAAGDVVELESFPDQNGLLLFIHTAPAGSAVWRFFDSEALLDAAIALPDFKIRPLYRWKDTYWLVSEGNDALSEFADRTADDPLLAARLAEYAQPLS